jgi:hypothetical protein
MVGFAPSLPSQTFAELDWASPRAPTGTGLSQMRRTRRGVQHMLPLARILIADVK